MSEKPKKKQLEEKVRILTKALSKDPKSRLFVPLAVAYLDLERPKEAEEVCREGINHYRDYYQAYTVLALSLIRQNRNEEAKKALQETVGHTRGNIKATRLLSSLYEEEGDYDQAIECLQQILPYCTAEERTKLEDKIRLMKTNREQQKNAAAEAEAEADDVLDFLESDDEPGAGEPADEDSAAETAQAFNEETPEEAPAYSADEASREEYENLGDQITDAELERQEREAEAEGNTIVLEDEDSDFSSAFGADALMGDMDAPVEDEEETDEDLEDILGDLDSDSVQPTLPTEPVEVEVPEPAEPTGSLEEELSALDTEEISATESPDDEPESFELDEEVPLTGDDFDVEGEDLEDILSLQPEQEAVEEHQPDIPASEPEPEPESMAPHSSMPIPPATPPAEGVEKYLGIPDDIWNSSLEEVARDMDDIIDLGREVLDVKDIRADEQLYKEYAQSLGLDEETDTQQARQHGEHITIDGVDYMPTATLARVFEGQGFPEKALQVYRHMDADQYAEEIAALEQLIARNENDLKRYDLHRSMEAIQAFRKKLQVLEQEGK
ncbi:hypothetical protein Selin_1835 [Desulfurispirillum indicum S5]|uniref:Uncharacterized protein n=1 Tax=Desulfurispirillum indicum (strain ATCC BAA-1389 / DSM 22839 / S5) TaxID=653733 RepID=E6W1L3_DESIS|nr:tetratricopeptide repeat protein [Desulfurispirillum indicum]ADU66562.1 hypothetical protein Selin_1835 [Desulfurispirillum indicum S5]